MNEICCIRQLQFVDTCIINLSTIKLLCANWALTLYKWFSLHGNFNAASQCLEMILNGCKSWIALDIKTQWAGKRYKFYFVSVESIESIDKNADIGMDVIVWW